MAIASNFPSIRPSLLLDFANVGRLDPRVTFSRASSGTYFDQLGVLQTAAAGEARFDHDPSTLEAQGLLIEEQRTNSIRNNTMQGAAAGTPGTLPTNYFVAGLGTLVSEVVSTGTENGIAYFDFRLSGTTSTTAFSLFYESNSQIVAASGQTWAASHYVKIAAGSTSNITAFRTSIRGNTAGGTITESNNTEFTPTSFLSRYTNTYTLADATSTRVNAFFNIAFSSGVAIDITLRIGLPQLEQGAFATSVIPTTTASVTRDADAASMTGTNFSDWFNNAEGTLVARGSYIGLQAAKPMVSINDSTSSNVIQIQTNPSTASTSRGYIASSGNAQATIGTAGVFALNQYSSLALAYKTDDFAMSSNGLAVSTDTSGTVPSVSRLEIGNAYGVQSSIYISRIAYYPQRLTDAQLQALTG